MPDKKIIRNVNKASLVRVFGNIISNMIKYSEGEMKVELLENGEMHFSNKAPKLQAVQVEKLFDRFFTVEDARISTGLGLSIARALTEEMGGSIRAESVSYTHLSKMSRIVISFLKRLYTIFYQSVWKAAAVICYGQQ